MIAVCGVVDIIAHVQHFEGGSILELFPVPRAAAEVEVVERTFVPSLGHLSALQTEVVVHLLCAKIPDRWMKVSGFTAHDLARSSHVVAIVVLVDTFKAGSVVRVLRCFQGIGHVSYRVWRIFVLFTRYGNINFIVVVTLVVSGEVAVSILEGSVAKPVEVIVPVPWVDLASAIVVLLEGIYDFARCALIPVWTPARLAVPPAVGVLCANWSRDKSCVPFLSVSWNHE